MFCVYWVVPVSSTITGLVTSHTSDDSSEEQVGQTRSLVLLALNDHYDGPQCKAKFFRQYLLTWKVSRYCLSALHDRTVMMGCEFIWLFFLCSSQNGEEKEGRSLKSAAGSLKERIKCSVCMVSLQAWLNQYKPNLTRQKITRQPNYPTSPKNFPKNFNAMRTKVWNPLAGAVTNEYLVKLLKWRGVLNVTLGVIVVNCLLTSVFYVAVSVNTRLGVMFSFCNKYLSYITIRWRTAAGNRSVCNVM